MGKVAQEEIRKGPWTEHEDVQLVFYVNLFGDRRWDFVAKVSGLKRTGKSCRLRWVNYLHPGLKRGKMTPQEERLVLELHSKWGNRWSRIARKLPGRTDNEIKNYWRTHMRKKAQERKRTMSPPSTGSNCSSSASSNAPANSTPNTESSSPSNNAAVDSMPVKETKERSFYDTGGDIELRAPVGKKDKEAEESDKFYSMDDIWKDMDLENDTMKSIQAMASPLWNYCPDLLLMMEGVDNKMFPTMTDQFFASSRL